MRWLDYLASEVEGDRHRRFPEWEPVGVWEFRRSDGLHTAHKTESPYPDWLSTVEESMRMADEHIPLGSLLPSGMRSREDPYYGPLFELELGN